MGQAWGKHAFSMAIAWGESEKSLGATSAKVGDNQRISAEIAGNRLNLGRCWGRRWGVDPVIDRTWAGVGKLWAEVETVASRNSAGCVSGPISTEIRPDVTYSALERHWHCTAQC